MSAAELLKKATRRVCEESGETWPDDADAEFDDPNVSRMADAFAELVLTERAAELERDATLMRNRMDMLEKALAEWINKTDWMRKTLKVSELGLHRADVMSARLRAAALAEPAPEPEGSVCARCGGLVFDPVLVQTAPPTVQHLPADDTEGGAI